MAITHINGAAIVKPLAEKLEHQDEKLERICMSMESIEKSLDKFGKDFDEIKNKVVDKLLDKALTKDDRTYNQSSKLINTLCWVIGLLVIWFTGLKDHLKDIGDILSGFLH